MLRVVFFASPNIALSTLDYLIASDSIDVVGVVTQADKPSGRGQKINISAIKACALAHDIPIFQPVSIRKETDIQEQLKALKPDFFVTFAFGQILSQEVLDIPVYETINLHVSLLPKYRGANPIQRAIMDGCEVTGICTMITVLALDAGDVCLREEISLCDDTTCVDVFEQVSQKSPKLIEQTLLGLVNGEIIPEPQCEEDGLCFAPKLKKEETRIDWNHSAISIHNLVRGIYKSPGAHFIFKEKIIKVKKTKVCEACQAGPVGEVASVTKFGLEVSTAEGMLLIEIVQPEGKKEMSAFDWANGAKIKAGEVLL